MLDSCWKVGTRWCASVQFLCRLSCAAVLCMSSTVPAHSQGNYPSRPVRVVVPFAAGVSPDIIMRIVGPKLGELMSQPVIIENRPGAAGNIGAGSVATASPDGYTFLYTINSVICANPHLYSKLPFEPFKSFVPVSKVLNLGYVLIGRKDLPVGNLQELIALAKSQPGKLSYASAGDGSGNHIVMELLTGMAGIRMLHVPSRGNSVTEVMSGQVDLVFTPYTTGVPAVKSGKVRVLGVTMPKRAESMPEVPAIGESLAGFVGDGWHGLFAPAGTPAAIVEKVSADIARALAIPDVRKRLVDMSLEPLGSTPAEFAAVVRRDFDKWGKVIRGANIKLD